MLLGCTKNAWAMLEEMKADLYTMQEHSFIFSAGLGF